MRVLENADEIALAQTLAIAAKQLARDRTHITGARSATVLGDMLDCTTHELERLVARETHATDTNPVSRLLDLSRRPRDDWLGDWSLCGLCSGTRSSSGRGMRRER